MFANKVIGIIYILVPRRSQQFLEISAVGDEADNHLEHAHYLSKAFGCLSGQLRIFANEATGLNVGLKLRESRRKSFERRFTLCLSEICYVHFSASRDHRSLPCR